MTFAEVVTDRVLLEVVPFSTIDDANSFNTALSGRLRRIGPAFDRYLENDRRKAFGTTKADADARFAARLLTLCVSWAPIEFVLQLLDGAELNLDQTGTDGDTPLIRALKLPDDGDTKAEKYGAAKSALVELLLARGAGPNVCDDEGHSPLYHAGYQKRMGDVIRKAGGYRSNIET